MWTIAFGIALLAIAAVGLLWAVRTGAPTHFAAQALVIAELGLMVIAKALIPDRTAATVVVAVLGIGTTASVIVQVRLVTQWKASVANR